MVPNIRKKERQKEILRQEIGAPKPQNSTISGQKSNRTFVAALFANVRF